MRSRIEAQPNLPRKRGSAKSSSRIGQSAGSGRTARLTIATRGQPLKPAQLQSGARSQSGSSRARGEAYGSSRPAARTVSRSGRVLLMTTSARGSDRSSASRAAIGPNEPYTASTRTPLSSAYRLKSGAGDGLARAA